MPIEVWRLLHFFFSFGYVGSLIVSDWNSRAARGTEDWAQRALLWNLVKRAGGVGLGTLIALGVLGNLLSSALGYRMSADAWPRWVNGLWLASVIVQGAVVAPGAARLLSLAQAALGGAPADGYAPALKRWRIANALQSVIYIALLVLMTFHWRG